MYTLKLIIKVEKVSQVYVKRSRLLYTRKRFFINYSHSFIHISFNSHSAAVLEYHIHQMKFEEPRDGN